MSLGILRLKLRPRISIRQVTYGGDFPSLESRKDAIELEFAIDILLLGLDIGRSVDLGRHDDD